MAARRGRGDGSVRQRRRADGSAYYEARVSIHGKQVSFYDDTKTGALAKARAAKIDADRGSIQAPGAITVEQYMQHWLEHTAKHSVRHQTFRSYQVHVVHHIIPAVGKVKLVDLAPGHVRSLLAKLLERGLSETTVKHVRSTLSGALRVAMIDYGIPRNAASLAKMPKTDKPAFRPEVITIERARQIVAAFRESRLEPIVMFAAATGLRQGELLALRWSDIDSEHRTVTVRHAIDIQDGARVLARPKTEKGQRVLALPALATRALELRQRQTEEDRVVAGEKWQGGDFVFANPLGGIRCGTTLTHNFKLHLERRGIEPVRWHALRRVFAAVLQDQGVSLVHIRDLMGHSEISVTESYAYTIPDSLHAAMANIDDALWPDGADGGDSARSELG